jgi:hypothetical protein
MGGIPTVETPLFAERTDEMHRVRGFFSGLTGDRITDTSRVKAEMGDLGLDDLRDLTYPITKAEVLEVLRNNGSSALLIDAVSKVPQNTFNDLNDLRSKIKV